LLFLIGATAPQRSGRSQLPSPVPLRDATNPAPRTKCPAPGLQPSTDASASPSACRIALACRWPETPPYTTGRRCRH